MGEEEIAMVLPLAADLHLQNADFCAFLTVSAPTGLYALWVRVRGEASTSSVGPLTMRVWAARSGLGHGVR